MRKVSTDGLIHTVAGGDGGPAVSALAGPTALALDPGGNLYFVDRNNNRVRRVDASGTIDTIVGSGAIAGQDQACVAPFGVWLTQPGGLALDPDGNLTSAIPGTIAFSSGCPRARSPSSRRTSHRPAHRRSASAISTRPMRRAAATSMPRA